MKTNLSGVSTENIHINNIAKNNFLLKVFYTLLMLIGIQFSYAHKLTFQFLYDNSQIESVSFYSNSGSYETAAKDGKLTVTSKVKGGASNVTVDTTIESGGSNTVATSFNDRMNFDLNHMVELTAPTPKAPKYLDWLVSGILYIEGEPVAGDFTLAHSPSSNNWWIATLNGSKYTPTQAMEVHTADGQYYCLNQNNNNYQVVVTSGSCHDSQYNDQDSKERKLLLSWHKAFDFADMNINDITFDYQGIHDDMHNGVDYLESVSTSHSGSSILTRLIKIDSQLASEADIADSFVNLFPSPLNFMNKNSKGNYKPTKLDYYIQGTLTIQGEKKHPEESVPDFTVALDQDGKTFWIGTAKGQVTKKGKMKIGDYCFHFTSDDKLFVKYDKKCK